MKKGIYILTAIIGILLIALMVWNEYRMVPFIPVAMIIYRGEPTYIYDKSMMSEEFQNRICLILDDNAEYYEKHEDGIWIRNYLLKDMEMLQNYSCKAGGNTPRIVDYPVTP